MMSDLVANFDVHVKFDFKFRCSADISASRLRHVIFIVWGSPNKRIELIKPITGLFRVRQSEKLNKKNDIF